jgi:hypothetical protein
MPIADRCRFYFAALPNTARKTVADISNTTNPINAEVRMGIFNILEQNCPEAMPRITDIIEPAKIPTVRLTCDMTFFFKLPGS